MDVLDFTRRKLVLSATRDSTTGWRLISYTPSTITGLRFQRGTHYSLQGVGFYAAEDIMILTADPVNVYDQILTQQNEYFRVKTVGLHYGPTPDNFLCRDLQCAALPLWEAAPGEATWKTSPNDPRERTKTWIDTYARNSEITKNDGSTQASWACIFNEPQYPLELEYRAPSSPVQGLYPIGQPTTTAQIGHDRKVYGYNEDVPIFIDTLDSITCSGEQLLWKMEAELRHVFENYEAGSYRGPLTRRPHVVDLGGTKLYEVECGMQYRRDLT